MATLPGVSESLPLPENVILLSYQEQSVLVKSAGGRLFFQGNPTGDCQWNPVHLRGISRPYSVRVCDIVFEAHPASRRRPAKIQFENSTPHKLRPNRLYRIDEVNKQVCCLKTTEEKNVLLRQLLVDYGFTTIVCDAKDRQLAVTRGRQNHQGDIWVTDGTVVIGEWKIVDEASERAELCVNADANFLFIGDTKRLHTALLYSEDLAFEQVLPYLSEYKRERSSIAVALVTHDCK